MREWWFPQTLVKPAGPPPPAREALYGVLGGRVSETTPLSFQTWPQGASLTGSFFLATSLLGSGILALDRSASPAELGQLLPEPGSPSLLFLCWAVLGGPSYSSNL